MTGPAHVVVPPEADLAGIAERAGAAALEARWYSDGVLFVAGVSQAALNAALSGVGPAPYVPVPASITPLQARQALRAAGLLPQVEAAIAAADDVAQDAWEYALEIERADPMLTAIAAGLGMTDAQIDDLFRSAAAG